MAKKREDIGVYFFEGFLEGGKTTYIQSLISDPQLPEDLRILILQTEEGMEELEPVPGREIFVEQLEGWDDITPEHLAELEDRTECNTIMVELNGMWQELDFFKRMPENWYPFRKFVIADASTFVSYNNNMRALAADKLKEYTDQIARSLGIGHGLIGRWEQFFDEKRINRVEPAGRQAGVFLQQMRLGEALAESGAKLQGCIHSIDVVWVEQTTDAEHTWQVINRQQLYRDEISSRAFFTYRYVDALHGIRVGTRAKVLHEPIVLPKAD